MSTATLDREQQSATAMVEFKDFSTAIARRFETMSAGELYVVDIDGDELWAAYLAAFPPGSNPIFRERTEHECSCCKGFVRNVGAVVEIVDGELRSVWSCESVGHPYDAVAQAMDELVRARPIVNLFRSSEGQYGAEKSRELRDGVTFTWNHFVGKLARRHHTGSVGEARGRATAAHQVLRRGLDEITPESVDTVLDLIAEGALYRGAEHESSIRAFRALQQQYSASPAPDLFAWKHVSDSAARFRNTVIGTLLVDLSEGRDIESAVAAFESKVAPENYQRPTALITKGMVEKALATLDGLGLRDAIERRHARLSDVSVNDVLFVDGSVQPVMRDGLADLLMPETKAPATPASGAVDIGAADFFANVLPTASAVQVLVEDRHLPNFMSVTAPASEGSGRLFKWGNDFAWAYDGDAADSIKARVKRAGGNVDAALRVSLAWTNFDDLDIHVIEPSGNRIYYGNKDGKLDVDMNVSPTSREPVENVSWRGRLQDGAYIVGVHNFTRRESHDVGFSLEVAFGEQSVEYRHDGAVPNHAMIDCLRLTVRGGELVSTEVMSSAVVAGSSSREKWGCMTGDFADVDTIIRSPNHWDGEAVGNLHHFFVLKGCRNPDPVRGMYNEFLSPALAEHRKVFEVLGSKTKCPPADDQLSGVGFSSTGKGAVILRVKTATANRLYNVQF